MSNVWSDWIFDDDEAMSAIFFIQSDSGQKRSPESIISCTAKLKMGANWGGQGGGTNCGPHEGHSFPKFLFNLLIGLDS